MQRKHVVVEMVLVQLIQCMWTLIEGACKATVTPVSASFWQPASRNPNGARDVPTHANDPFQSWEQLVPTTDSVTSHATHSKSTQKIDPRISHTQVFKSFELTKLDPAPAPTSHLPAVVLVGLCGCGKSTLVEKLTGVSNISSASHSSATRKAQKYFAPLLTVVDTPGTNGLQGTEEQNLWIATGLNWEPVSLILICVEASERLESSFEPAIDFLVKFEAFSDLVGVIFTKMDKPDIRWTPQDMLEAASELVGSSLKLLFSSANTTSEELTQAILRNCGPKRRVDVVEDNFMVLFDVEKSNYKNLGRIQEELTQFEQLVTYVPLIFVPVKHPFFLDLFF
jgi:GTP-binding protein EngB required for normal cell division